MVASIKPHRDELGLGDGRMLIGGDWVTAADEATWSHVHPATGEQVAALHRRDDVTGPPAARDQAIAGGPLLSAVTCGWSDGAAWCGAARYRPSGPAASRRR